MLLCTYHRVKARHHRIYEDFTTVAAGDIANSSAIRIFEQKTDARIAALRKEYGIPEDMLPPDEWLWLEEFLDVSPAIYAEYACGVRSRSTFTRVLAERSWDPARKSLVELGYVKVRFIARRGSHLRPARAFTEVHYDRYGEPFIIVEDDQGYYLDDQGELHWAVEEGYTRITKQYLYCFEVVNAKIAAIDGSIPPELPRWQPPAGKSTQQVARNSTAASQRNTSTTTKSGGYTSSAAVEASTGKDIIDGSLSSTIPGKISEDLRIAPRTPPTFLGLLSTILPVPDPEVCGPDTWEREWEQPLRRLIAATSILAPSLAWERIGTVAYYMTDQASESWFVQGRARQTPITARHVADNFIVQWNDAKAKGYQPPVPLATYDGPVLEYEQGYTGATPAQEPAAPEELAPHIGMRRRTADRLAQEVWERFPDLVLGVAEIEGSGGRCCLGIQIGDGQYHDLFGYDEWRNNDELEEIIVQAQRYAAQRHAKDDAVELPPVVASPEEPPLTEMPAAETPLVAAEPSSEYLSMEEISAQLSTQPPASEATLSEQPPGMRLAVAQALLNRILQSGYQAERCDLGPDLAVLRVEIRPGEWVEIASASEWPKRLREAATSPPVNMATALAMSPALEQVVAQ